MLKLDNFANICLLKIDDLTSYCVFIIFKAKSGGVVLKIVSFLYYIECYFI